MQESRRERSALRYDPGHRVTRRNEFRCGTCRAVRKINLTYLTVSNIYKVCETDIRILFHRWVAFHNNIPGLKNVSSPSNFLAF